MAESGALQVAAAWGSIENIEYLLILGFEVDDEGDNIWGTALSAAASNGRKEAAAYLLNGGANSEKRATLTSLTPVEEALSRGHEDVAEMIREFIAGN